MLIVCAAAMPVATVAHAQGSVTLYGLIDEGFETISNATTTAGALGGRQFRLDATNGLNSSRWGLKGREELGGALTALFQLENGFELNNGRLGQGGALFGRQAFVGIESKQLGTLTLGRQYDSIVDYVGKLEFGDSNVGTGHSAHPADLDNFNNSRRTNNAVKYTSNDYGGLTFGGIYSLGGVAGSVARNQVFSLGSGYHGGPVTLGIAYLQARNPATSLFGSNPNETPTSNGLTGTPVLSGYAGASAYNVIGAGALYALGDAVLGANYSNVRFSNIPALGNSSAIFNDFEVNLQYHVTPRLLTGIAYNYLHSSHVSATVGGANYSQFSAGMNYTLSRRTDVYAALQYQTANGHDSTGASAVASIAGVSPSLNRQQTVGRVGLRHRF
ncbi:porin [Paraburkholderia bengalensis]|uniref:Porin n=2 Tax=Paraburkholderia bengalensis TaxID=2747562 RepID=A0ABU8IY91_9BURK